MKIHKETWQDANGLCLDIAFNELEVENLPYAYRFEKRKILAEEHGFNFSNSCRMRTIEVENESSN